VSSDTRTESLLNYGGSTAFVSCKTELAAIYSVLSNSIVLAFQPHVHFLNSAYRYMAANLSIEKSWLGLRENDAELCFLIII